MENKLMMKLVIGTEALFFLSLLISFVYYGFTPGFERGASRQLDIQATGLFSVLLLASSFTFWRAEVSHRRGNRQGIKGWLGVTIALGIVFLFGQAREYWGLLDKGVTVSSGIFTTSFFTLTGFHGLHVLVGLLILSVLLWLTILGDFRDPNSTVISSAGLYWHFVDAVWVVVFTVVYLGPQLFSL